MPASQELQNLGDHIDELTFGAAEFEPHAAPLPPPEALRFKRILVAVDGSEGATHALEWAKFLGRKFGARVWVVAVLSSPAYARYFGNALGKPYNREILDAEKRAGEEVVADAVMELRNADVDTDEMLAAGSPAQEIAKAADSVEADLVIVGGASGGLEASLPIGSVADAVKNLADASVLIAKTPPGEGPLLAAVDGSALSKRAAAIGREISRELDEELAVLHVVHVPVFGDQASVSRAFDENLEERERQWHDAGVDYVVRFGETAQTIATEARERNAELVIVGARGLSGLPLGARGSVANGVVHRADRAVLVVKEREGGAGHT